MRPTPRVGARAQPAGGLYRAPEATPSAPLLSTRGLEGASALPDAPKPSDQAILDQARQDKARALAALPLVGSSPEARKPYEDMIRKADADIQRLEPLIAQAKAAETYR